MKQSKQPSFWKPDKVSLLKPAPMNVLLDYPKSTSSFNPMPTNHKLFGFDTKIYKPKSAFTKSISIFNKGVKAQKNLKVVNTNINLPKKEMNWFQAKSKFPKLNPFKDADKDGVMNMYDCKPFNKGRQEEFKAKTQMSKTKQKILEKKQILKDTKFIKWQDKNITPEDKKEQIEYEKNQKSQKKVKESSLGQEYRLPPPPASLIKYVKERGRFPDADIISNNKFQNMLTVVESKQSSDLKMMDPTLYVSGDSGLNNQRFDIDNKMADIYKLKLMRDLQKNQPQTTPEIEELRTKRDKLKLKMKLEAQEKFRKIAEEGKLKRVIENKDLELKKLATRELEAGKRAETSIGKTEARIKTAEERRIRYEGMAGPRMVKNISALVNKMSGTGRRSYKDRWVSGQNLLRISQKQEKADMIELAKSLQQPSRIQRTEPYAVTKLKEIQNRLPPPSPIKEISQKQPAPQPIKTKETGKIIFDMPVKSRVRQFVEKVVRKAPDVYVAERLRRHENVALPTITREDYATKNEKKIGEAERKRIEDESPYEKSTEYEGVYKEKRYAKDLVDELNKEAKETSKKEARENKAERKRGRKEAKQEKIQERKESREERKAEKKIKTDDFGTEYKSSAQSIIDEA